jgi:hypothetical protein
MFVLDSGAMVRAQLDTATLTGEVRKRFTDSSADIVICLTHRRPCANPEDLLILPVGSIRRLAVRGKQTGSFALLGFYLGALAEMGLARHVDTGMLAGGFGGGALGALIGSKSVGWLPLFPCMHVCAGGHYPQPP